MGILTRTSRQWLLCCWFSVLLAGSVVPSRSMIAQDPAGRNVTLKFKNITLDEALKRIATASGVTVIYSADLVPLDRKVSLSVSDVSALNAIQQVLQGTAFVPEVTGPNQISLVRSDARAESPQDMGIVTGQVLDSLSKKGVPGVTVAIEGTKLATTTGTDGRFMIRQVSPGTVRVTTKLVGYRTNTISVVVKRGETTSLTAILRPTAATLSEVVTTATGAQRKYEIGNSITSVNVDSVMRVAPVTSLTDLLETRVPGLTVQRTSGIPGDPARLRLRGAASINSNNDPIVVVDGVRMYAAQSDKRSNNIAPARDRATYAAPSPLDQIDPNSIETIDVFKGPSAAALYGSDAANGVIVITTKRGRVGPPRWNLALNQGIAYLPDKYPEGVYRWGTFGIAGVSLPCNVDNPNCTLDSIVRYQALNDPYQTILGRGSSSGVTLGISGGPQTIQYALSGSMSSEGDYLKLSDAMLENYAISLGRNPPDWMRKPGRYRTWGGQGRIDASIRSDLNVSFTSSLFHSAQQRSSLGLGGISDLMSQYLRPSPVVHFEGYKNYFEQVTSEQQNTQQAVQGNWRVLSWLPLSLTAGLQTLDRTDEAVVPRGVTSVTLHGDTIGRYGLGRGTTTTRSASLTTTIPTFRDRVTTVFGLNYMREAYTDLRASIGNLPPGIALPTDGLLASQNTGGRTSFGWLVEPKFNLHSRFFLIPGFRLDNNGLSGSAAKLMGLPKMNVSWLISDEPFFRQSDLVSLLRLRAGYGSAGVQPGPIDRLRLYTLDTSAWVSGIYQGGASLSQLGNTRLRPERGTEWEGGFEAAFWRNRVSVDATWYRKMRYDAIESIPLPSSLSSSFNETRIYSNIGVIRNQGMDASISAQVIERSAISWFVTVSMWENSNLVQRLKAGQQPITVNVEGPDESKTYITPAVTRIVAGYPLFGWWARPILSYGDADGDHVIEGSEIVMGDTVIYLGQQEPGRTMNVSTTMTFLSGRLSLNAAAAYTGRFSQFNASAKSYAYSPFRLGANDPNASPAQQAAALALTPYGRILTTTAWRFQSFAINYVIQPSIARLFRASNMSVAIQGSNLGLKTNYSGKDPNVNSYTTGNATVDAGVQPQPRTWSLRVTLGN